MKLRSRSCRRAAAGMLPALTALLALSLAGCGPSGNSPAALAPNQTFRWPYINATAVENPTAHIAVFDPAVVSNYVDASTVMMLYSGLVTLDSATLQVIPDLASRWSLDSTGTVYTFELRSNIFFSDGTPITAEDFAYSLNRALANQAGVCTDDDAATYNDLGPACFALGSSYLGVILGAGAKGDTALTGVQSNSISLIGHNKGLEAVDPRTLVIRLAHPAAYFLEALDDPVSYPVEQSLVTKYSGGTWVDHLQEGGCSGPFKVKAYIPGKELEMVPNPLWWGRKLTLTEVDRPFLSSKDSEYSQYDKAGDYEFTDVPADVQIFAQGQADYHQVATLATDYFGLNWNVPPFTDVRIRQAFDLALNKQLLVDRVFDGTAVPTNHIVPQGMPGYNPLLLGPDRTQSVTGNQVKAVALLRSAQQQCQADGDTQGYCPYIDDGAASRPIKLAAASGTDASQKEIATIATQTWSQALGLNVQIYNAGDLNGVQAAITNPASPAQVWQIGWLADYADPQDWISLQFHSGAGNNLSNVDDPHLDALMDQADEDLDANKRMSQYNTLEQDLVNLVPWIPYAQERRSYRLRSWVQGFALNDLLVMEDIEWSGVFITAH
jgi:oligopeptide transport system substrate-binding protein